MKLAAGLMAALLIGRTVAAAEWVSPDGAIAIDAPATDRFSQETDLPEPALVRWSSPELPKVIVVTRQSVPAGVRLQKSGLEEGTLSQVTDGSIVSSTSSTISGMPAFTIVAKGKLSGVEMFLAQTITAFDNQVYKVMVVSPTDPMADADVGPALKSLRIVKASPTPPAAAPTPAGSTPQRNRMNEYSVMIAQVAWLALAVAGVLWFLSSRKRAAARRATPPPPPQMK